MTGFFVRVILILNELNIWVINTGIAYRDIMFSLKGLNNFF